MFAPATRPHSALTAPGSNTFHRPSVRFVPGIHLISRCLRTGLAVQIRVGTALAWLRSYA
eukprot:2774015-Rhodomonas_salina.1